jgi:hypothetical protein
MKKYLMATFVILLTLATSTSSFAHIMVAQHGTLNVVNNGVFMVISLPVTAFKGIDDDHDGKLSTQEFNRHRQMISKTVINNIILKNNNEQATLTGLLLSPMVSHSLPTTPSSQIVITGRFVLTTPDRQLRYSIGLFGKKADEQLFNITAINSAEHKKQLIELTPHKSSTSLFTL